MGAQKKSAATAPEDKVVPIATRLPRRKKGRQHPFRMAIYIVFFAVVIGGLIYFVTNRNELSADVFADLFSRLRFTLEREEEDQANAFSYDDYMLSRYAAFQKGLVLLSGDRLAIYGSSGREKYGVDCGFENPALVVSDRTVLAYDRGGQAFVLTDNSATLLKMEWDGVLYTACMNRKGAFALVSSERGYASVCTVFDDRQTPKYKWRFRDQIIIDAALSPSSGLLALVSGGQESDRFVGRVTLLDTRQEDGPVMSCDLPDVLPLHVGFLKERLFYVVTEEGVSFYNEKGESLCDWSFKGDLLLSCAAGDGKLVLCLTGGGSNACDLVLLDGDGLYAQRTISGSPVSLSAAGDWLGVLVGGRAYVYNAELEPRGQPAETAARALVMRADGSALLLERSGTTVYKP